MLPKSETNCLKINIDGLNVFYAVQLRIMLGKIISTIDRELVRKHRFIDEFEGFIKKLSS